MSESMVMKPLIAVIGFIIVLSGYGLMTSGINDWTLLTYATGVVDGARVERVVAYSGSETSADAWYDDSLTEASGSDFDDNEWAKVKDNSGGCILDLGTVRRWEYHRLLTSRL